MLYIIITSGAPPNNPHHKILNHHGIGVYVKTMSAMIGNIRIIKLRNTPPTKVSYQIIRKNIGKTAKTDTASLSNKHFLVTLSSCL